MVQYCAEIKDLNDKLQIVPTTGTISQTLQVPHAAAIKATAMPAKMQKTPASLPNTNTEGLNTNTQNKRRRQKKNDISQHKPAESVETESPSQAPQTSCVVPSETGTVIKGDSPITVSQIPDTEQWTEVKKRRTQRPASLCGTADSKKTTLKAVEPRRYIHLWNMESDADDVRDYLRELCPVGTCTVQELTPRGDYKSYKIGVPVAYYDVCFTTEVWPVNARIKNWVTYKKPVKSAQDTQSFRNSSNSFS